MIVKNKVPGIDAKLAEQITGFMQQLRIMKLEKTPGHCRNTGLGHGFICTAY